MADVSFVVVGNGQGSFVGEVYGFGVLFGGGGNGNGFSQGGCDFCEVSPGIVGVGGGFLSGGGKGFWSAFFVVGDGGGLAFRVCQGNESAVLVVGAGGGLVLFVDVGGAVVVLVVGVVFFAVAAGGLDVSEAAVMAPGDGAALRGGCQGLVLVVFVGKGNGRAVGEGLGGNAAVGVVGVLEDGLVSFVGNGLYAAVFCVGVAGGLAQGVGNGGEFFSGVGVGKGSSGVVFCPDEAAFFVVGQGQGFSCVCFDLGRLFFPVGQGDGGLCGGGGEEVYGFSVWAEDEEVCFPVQAVVAGFCFLDGCCCVCAVFPGCFCLL